ncbi:hypothetical protein [Colwellia sp. RSH04]|uniref:hypothetical protein n=1 Tax=Colwellia sp. RSH04 TaxID=2305464 RepID=UPI000E56A07E|nr:hypothetical protein [Colwellia sp. RSH04]RHW77791.1 hypothetical protein D1094_02340 [Colwellia sp. RSH04]
MIGMFITSTVYAVEVIVNVSVKDTTLTTSQLKRIYTMRQLRWSDQSVIKVFVLPSQHELHRRFTKERLQIFPYQLNRIWHKLTYSGLGVAPTIVNSPEELFTAVSLTPGSIGYIDMPDSNLDEGAVNVINIED